MATPRTATADSQWPLWEVFLQPPKGDAARARGQRARGRPPSRRSQNARDVYARRGEAVSIWVVPSAAITASTPDDMGPFFDPGERQAVPASAVLQGAARRSRCSESAARTSTMSVPRSSRTSLRLGDDRLVLGHRLVRVVRPRSDPRGGHRAREHRARPDRRGDAAAQARGRSRRAGPRRGRARVSSATRSTIRNALLVELPKGDFALHDRATVLLQRLLAAADGGARSRAANAELAGIAAKAVKETRYHVRHSAQWVVTLGDGTDESHARAQRARRRAVALHRRAVHRRRRRSRGRRGRTRRRSERRSPTRGARRSTTCCARATLTIPAAAYMQRGGREGRHTEHLGHMLVGDADRRALASGGHVVTRGAGLRRATSCSRSSTTVMDPEVPVLSVVELGIVRDVERRRRRRRRDDHADVLRLSGDARDRARDSARRSRRTGVGPVEVRTTYSPAWTTDWMSATARAKLEAYGIAPPGPARRRRRARPAASPRGACRVSVLRVDEHEQKSEFGSTACKSIWRLPRRAGSRSRSSRRSERRRAHHNAVRAMIVTVTRFGKFSRLTHRRARLHYEPRDRGHGLNPHRDKSSARRLSEAFVSRRFDAVSPVTRSLDVTVALQNSRAPDRTDTSRKREVDRTTHVVVSNRMIESRQRG